MQKRNLFLILAAVLIFTAIGGVAVYASTANGTNRMSSLVNAIAAKFNLDPAAVQQVVNDQQAQQQAQRQAQEQQKYTDMLNQAVTAGKLTQAQVTLILNEKATIDAQNASLKGDTQAQRQAAMQAQKTSIQQWATANNIPAQYLSFGGFGGRGPMGGMNPGVFGTVSAIDGNTLTVTGKTGPNGGTATTYTVDATNAKITKNNSASSVSGIATGDTVMVQGTISGTSVAATAIRDGVMDGRGWGGFGAHNKSQPTAASTTTATAQ